MGGGGGEQAALGYIPTWIIAVVVAGIIAISLTLERCLHMTGKYLQRKNQKPLYEALQKVKEELMLLGFISLLLTVFQQTISRICIDEKLVSEMLPCSPTERKKDAKESVHVAETHRTSNIIKRMLAEESLSHANYCAQKGKVPFLSVEALHHLHMFIFVLAVAHVVFSLLTVIFGGAKIHQWQEWEDSLPKENYDTDQALKAATITDVHQHDFIQKRALWVKGKSSLLGWVHSFFKQFYGSVTKSDYLTLRIGFIMTHCRSNPNFNFHKYMMRALEDDFKQVVGISWYLWSFVIVFLLLNVHGWNAYFWMALIPFILLLSVGTKLEHIIMQLANDVAEKHIAIEGELVVQPSDDHFWFHRPEMILVLIHFILFQNAFEIAFFFWIWVQYGFHSCIMGHSRYIGPRLVIGAIVQVLCSYSTLPLYAIVTQMGTNYKKAIFDEHIQAGLISWAQMVKKKNKGNKGLRKPTTTRSPAEPASRVSTDKSNEESGDEFPTDSQIELITHQEEQQQHEQQEHGTADEARPVP